MEGIWLVGTPFGLSGTSGERKGPPKGIFCPKRCPFGGPSSAVEVFEEAGAHDMDTAQPDGSASGSWAQIRPLGAAKGPPGPPKGVSGQKLCFLSFSSHLAHIMTCNTDTRTSRWGYDLGRAEAFNMLSCLGHNAGVSLGKLGEKQP